LTWQTVVIIQTGPISSGVHIGEKKLNENRSVSLCLALSTDLLHLIQRGKQE
jgi:hypothetical protein